MIYQVWLICGVVISTLLLLELAVRGVGFIPWNVAPVKLTVEPGGKLYQTNDDLGYSHIAGAYTITLPDDTIFQATHGDDSFRITSDNNSGLQPYSDGEIWIFGDSYVYGIGVDDSETVAWKLQSALPDDIVRNCGVSGYGTVHQVALLERLLLDNTRPKLVILTYSSFHDDRNVLTPKRKKYLATHNHLGPLDQLVARFNDEQLEIYVEPIEYKPLLFARRSALVNILDEYVAARISQSGDGLRISTALLASAYEMASSKNVKCIVGTLTRDEHTTLLATSLENQNIPVVDLYVDLSDPLNRVSEHDAHPGPIAHEMYAQKLLEYIVQIE